MNRIDILETILQTLKDTPESVQQPFKDALMVHSDNQWHNLVSNNLESLIDTENEDDLWERVNDDGEGLDRLLSKNDEMRLSKETVSKLYNDKRKLTKDEKYLIEAFLNE